jgi:hypothetical protein
MKCALLALLGLITACSGGSGEGGGASDGASDGSAGDAPPLPVVEGGSGDSEVGAPDACADASVPPSTLACTGLYSDFATKEVAANALSYTPSTPLWSDGAQKQRWIELPPDTQIDISNPNEWTFPVGTKLFKEFRVDGQRVETRMFQKTESNFWVYATYAWNSDDSAATINFGGPVAVGDAGVTWTIPTNDDCDECHRGRQDRILGFEQVSLGLPNAQGLTLAALTEMGLVTPAPASVSLTVGDDGTGLDALALGWLHVNCGVTCHNANPAAAGFGAGMLLRLDPTQLDGGAPSAATWDILRTTLGVPCVSGGLVGQPRIQPGAAAHSVLYQLVDERGTLQMPPIGSAVVDTTDVAVVASWIQAMIPDAGAPSDGGGPPGDGGLPPLEAGAIDAGSSDAALADASALDAEAGTPPAPDAGAIDAGNPDATLPDAAVPDATVPDAEAEAAPATDADETDAEAGQADAGADAAPLADDAEDASALDGE